MSLPDNLQQFQVPEPVLEVVQGLQKAGYAAYLVGGCVRDMVLGRPPADFDVATSARPEQVKAAQIGKVIPTGIEHGTVTVIVRGVHVEVTTFRTEGEYVDGRRPSSVTFHDQVEADLSRRDFTINAMAFEPEKKELVDPFGGQDDLGAKLIRCVGSAMDRFSEDGLRPLRAVRFAAVLGFSLHRATLEAIPRTLDVFAKVSRERIRVELEKLLLAPKAEVGLRLLLETGLLQRFLPEAIGEHPEGTPAAAQRKPKKLEDLLAEIVRYEARAASAGRAPGELEVRLAALLSSADPEVAREALRRLTFSNKVVDRVALLVRRPAPERPLDASDADLRRWMSLLGADAVPQAVSLHLALHPEQQPGPVRERIDEILSSRPPLSAKELALNGNEIMKALGVGPSPIVGDATRHLLEKVIEDPAANTPERLAELLAAFAAAQGS